jgi:hypothetical protein
MDSALARVQLYFRALSRPQHNNAGSLSRRPCQEECTHCHKVQTPADLKQLQAFAAGTAAGRDAAALRMDELYGQDTGPILEEC